MKSIKQAFMIDDKVIVIGDKVKLVLYDNNVREGTLNNIDMRYKSVTVTIKDDTVDSGYSPLRLNFDMVKDIIKI